MTESSKYAPPCQREPQQLGLRYRRRIEWTPKGRQKRRKPQYEGRSGTSLTKPAYYEYAQSGKVLLSKPGGTADWFLSRQSLSMGLPGFLFFRQASLIRQFSLARKLPPSPVGKARN